MDDNVIEHPAAVAKQKADDYAARISKHAEYEAAEKKERREHRAELKATKPERDAMKLLQQKFDAAKQTLWETVNNGAEFLLRKADRERGGECSPDFMTEHTSAYITIMEAQLSSVEVATALACGFASYADLLGWLERDENSGEEAIG